MTITAATVLDEANAQHQSSWRLHGRLDGGYQSGAYLVVDPAGRRAVLKWSDSREWAPTVLAAAPVVSAARAGGWPTPAWLAVGLTEDGHPYQLQDFVEGTAQETLTHHWLDLVLPVVAAQAGLGGNGMRNWSRHDRDVVFAELDGNRAAVVNSGPTGVAFDAVVGRLTRDHVNATLPVADLVHGDLNPENVLVAGDGQATFVDVEAVGRGTRLHDLTTLLIYATLWGEHDVQHRLIDECRVMAEPGWMEISLSAVAVDLLAFGVRRWPTDDLAAACEAATGLLSELGNG